MENVKVEVRTKLNSIFQDAWNNTDSASQEAYKFREMRWGIMAHAGFNSFNKTIHETLREQWKT